MGLRFVCTASASLRLQDAIQYHGLGVSEKVGDFREDSHISYISMQCTGRRKLLVVWPRDSEVYVRAWGSEFYFSLSPLLNALRSST